jgi:inhibitor of KinA sporulation pathway (predicted exonuclease)
MNLLANVVEVEKKDGATKLGTRHTNLDRALNTARLLASAD